MRIDWLGYRSAAVIAGDILWILYSDGQTMLEAEMPQTNAFLYSEFGLKGKCRYSPPP